MALPTARQLQYLRSLALRAGQTFAVPKSAAEASREIERLRSVQPSSRTERRMERADVQRALAERPDDATAVRDREITGYGSRAAWSQSAGEEAGPCAVHCKREPYDVYVGRAAHGMPGSQWGNPFREGKDGTREQVIDKYRSWLLKQPQLLGSLDQLRGKRLGCWCAPQACHADVLVELANAPRERQLELLRAAQNAAARRRPALAEQPAPARSSPPSAAQLHYVERLAARAGADFRAPASREEASREIQRLQRARLDAEQRRESAAQTARKPELGHREEEAFREQARERSAGALRPEADPANNGERIVGRYSVPEGERVLVAVPHGERFAVRDQPAPQRQDAPGPAARGPSYPVEPAVRAQGLGALAADYVAAARRLGAIPMAYAPTSSFRAAQGEGAPQSAYERAREQEAKRFAERALARRTADEARREALRQRREASRRARVAERGRHAEGPGAIGI